MIREKMKKSKIVVIAVSAALCLSLGMGTLVIFAQDRMEGEVKFLSEEEKRASLYPAEWKMARYKDDVSDPKIGKAVCEKYGLDFETVTKGAMTREMYDYEFALELRSSYQNLPLLNENAENPEELYGDSTLENLIGDIFAFGGAEEIIRAVCEENRVNVNQVTVGDLSVEMLVEIQDRAFHTSDHGK